VLLGEFLRKVYVVARSEDQFDGLQQVTETSAEWTERLKNLQKVLAALERFTAKLAVEKPKFQVDLVAIAVSQDPIQLQALLELVTFCVIHSEAKDLMITRILQLSQPAQVTLMHFIKQTTREEDDSVEFIMTPSRELKQMRRTQATLSSQLVNVQSEYEVVWKEKERIELENTDLKLTNTDLESKLTSRVQRRNYTPDSIILELEVRLNEKDQKIQQLSDELADIKRLSERNMSQFKDELDQAVARAESLAKAEENAQLLRTTVEELKPLKERLREVQEENEALKRRMKGYEEEDSKLQSTNRHLAQAKDAVAVEKGKRRELEDELHLREQTIKLLQRDNQELLEKLQLIESKNRELAFRLDQVLTENNTDDSFAIGTPLRELGESSLVRSDHPSALMDDIQPKALDFWASDKSLKGMREAISLANENRELRSDKEALSAELERVKEATEVQKATQEAEIETIRTGWEREVKGLKAALEEAESHWRNSNRDLTDQIMHLSATTKAAEMINSTLIEEIAGLRTERDTEYEELSRVYREKDEITSRFLSSRDETLKLNSDIAEKMMKLAALEHELALAKDQSARFQAKSTESQQTVRDLELVENGRKISALKLRLAELDSRLQEKDIITQQADSRIKGLQDKLVRSRQRHERQRSEITRLARSKEELACAMTKERTLLQCITSEMVKTMSDLQGLMETKGS